MTSLQPTTAVDGPGPPAPSAVNAASATVAEAASDGRPERRLATPSRPAIAPPSERGGQELASHTAGDAQDISDQELGRIIVIGAVVGTALIFVLVAGLCLAVGAGLGQAVGIGAVPAFFGGWFYGGAALMLRAADRTLRR